MIQYQITIRCNTNQYKPISCILNKPQSIDLTNRTEKVKLISEGVQKICIQKGWTRRDLLELGYTRSKVREYNRELIEQEKAVNYALIKAIKYSTGEWKKPSNTEE